MRGARQEVPGVAPPRAVEGSCPVWRVKGVRRVSATKWSVTTGTAEDEASGLRKPAGHTLELGGVAPDDGSELSEELRLVKARVGRQVEVRALTSEAFQALILPVSDVHPVLEPSRWGCSRRDRYQGGEWGREGGGRAGRRGKSG